jgi:hypothetical protein
VTLFDPIPNVEDALRERGAERMEQARLAAEAGQEAQARADAHAAPEWKDQADDAIRRAARLLPRFTMSDVWDPDVGACPPCSEPRRLGPRLVAAAAAGLIRSTTDYLPGRRVVAHGRPERVWVSLIVEP